MLARVEVEVARPIWFPDWSGQYCAIVATGPSVKRSEVETLRGRLKVIAIKESGVELAPWADVLYGCDYPWWKHRQGAPAFKGLKFSWDDRVSRDFPDVRRVEIPDKTLDRLLFGQDGAVGAGGSSGFQALNLSFHFRAKGVLLMGFDMNDHAPSHWHGRNIWPKANNPDISNFERWRKAFGVAAQQLQEAGIDAVNVSSVSSLKCFRRAPLEQALAEWGI